MVAAEFDVFTDCRKTGHQTLSGGAAHEARTSGMKHFYFYLTAGSVGDLDGGEENTADSLSLSGEEGGASDPEDSAEGDSSSPRTYTPVYNEGKARTEGFIHQLLTSFQRKTLCPHRKTACPFISICLK